VHFVADLFGVSSGTVVKSTERVVKGLKRLAPSVICWPNTQRRAQQAEWAGSSYGFDNCIGATDGTTFPLAYQPALHLWSYYDRKGRYSLNAVITCDRDGYLINVVQGCTGAAPDAFVQTLFNWHRYPQVYFSAGQYLLGDKGMNYSAWVIGPFLKPECTTSDRRNFNYQLARLRVRSEHAIGMLKGRFSSLKELRLRLNGEKDYDSATSWVLVCCIFHNICRQHDDLELETTDAVGPNDPWVEPGAHANEARNSVMENVCQFMRASGTYRNVS